MRGGDRAEVQSPLNKLFNPQTDEIQTQLSEQDKVQANSTVEKKNHRQVNHRE